MEANAGSLLKVTSVCHSSVSGGLLESFSNKTISGKSLTCGYTGCGGSISPKLVANAI